MTVEIKKILLAGLSLSVLFFNTAAAPVQSDFKAAWWCKGGHAQTICGALFRSDEKIALERRQIETPDGDFFFTDWLKTKARAPLVVVLHGLGSSSDAKYVQVLLKEIRGIGWQAVVVNARGTFALNRTRVMDHSGRTEDLNQTIEMVVKQNLADDIYLVGFSAGGNKVLKWLGEKGNAIPPQVKKAVTVSAASDLAKAVGNLDRGFDKLLYTRMLLKNLKNQALAKNAQFPGLFDEAKIKQADTFRIYDRKVTAPLAGFKDEKEYWDKSSSYSFLKNIERPTLMIHAQNDPFLHGDELALAEIERSPYLHLLMTQDGGHVGFISGKIPFRSDRWVEKRIVEYFKSEQDQ